MKTHLFSSILWFILSCGSLYAQNDLIGTWRGAITIIGQDLKILVHFATDNQQLTAKIDIPQQMAKGIPLQHIVYNTPKISFELVAGTAPTAKFAGEKNGNEIQGKFTQATYEGTFKLQKGEPNTEEVQRKEPVPYQVENVSFQNGETTFGATLTLPPHSGKHPALVLITGSGPQDRNEEIFGFKAFEIVADYFTRQGIAVLRYDDRGVGETKGGKSILESTSEDFAYDVLQAVEYLKTRPEIDAQQIGLYGHSEGGIVAPLAAVKNPQIAFIILSVGTGVKGIEILNEQKKLILEANGASAEVIAEELKMNDLIYKTVISNRGWEKLNQKLSEDLAKAFQLKGEALTKAVDAQITNLKTPWWKYFMQYDPAPTLRKVKCPVLLLFGELDLQVPPAQSEQVMLNTLKKGKNKDYESKTFAKANHLFQEAKTGNPSEYGILKKEFVEGYLGYIAEWLRKRIKVVP
ncbi:MAG: alpha/beta hydrolase [Microscillaceae bacterium]|jgi:hypothetical protein|nr:alpha/beta hydrolase [Microscillaceae bacterium]